MKLKLFALNASKQFGEEIAHYLDIAVCPHEERRFEDGEAYVAPSSTDEMSNVRGSDVFVVQSCYADGGECVDQKLMKLYIMLGSLRDASAGRITAVLPYYPYARQDRKTASRAPVTTKYVSALISQFADRVLAMDVHEPKAIDRKSTRLNSVT